MPATHGRWKRDVKMIVVGGVPSRDALCPKPLTSSTARPLRGFALGALTYSPLHLNKMTTQREYTSILNSNKTQPCTRQVRVGHPTPKTLHLTRWRRHTLRAACFSASESPLLQPSAVQPAQQVNVRNHTTSAPPRINRAAHRAATPPPASRCSASWCAAPCYAC